MKMVVLLVTVELLDPESNVPPLLLSALVADLSVPLERRQRVTRWQFGSTLQGGTDPKPPNMASKKGL